MVNLRTFDLNLLRVLDVLFEEPQVSAAARRLSLSQPATSAALKRLRDALGDPLLVRGGHQMVPTPLAERLRPKVRRLIADIEETLRTPESFNPAHSERSFRIAANDYAVIALVCPLLRQLQRCAPRITVEILPFEDDFERRLAEDNYDLAIRDRWTMRSWRHLETVFQEDYICIARRDHPRLSRKPTLDEFLAEGHVLISPAGRTQGIVDSALDRVRRKRHVTITLPHFLAAPAVIARTDYIMTIARRAAEETVKTYNLRTFPPPFRLPGFEVAMAWHPRSRTDAGVRWLREQVSKTAARKL
jgi:DNA-binding transcriptional LysR family regulator